MSLQNKILPQKFYERATLKVAQNLLGKVLVHKVRGRELRGVITETEAYLGERDKACHSAYGRTARTEVMFGPAGRAYIYLIYGIHEMMNIVTRKENCPEAVLIRGIQTFDGENFDGPGKLTRYLKISRSLNGHDLTKKNKLWLEDAGIKIKKSEIKCSPRIGIDFVPQPWRDLECRFYVQTLNLKSMTSPSRTM